MSETRGSTAKVKWDKPPDRLNPKRTGRQLQRITVLVDEVGTLWIEALEAGTQTGSGQMGGRGTGFTDTDPTSRAALSPTQKQLRGKVRYASRMVEEAMERLEQAASTLTDGFLLTDEEVLTRFLEKRRAATQG